MDSRGVRSALLVMDVQAGIVDRVGSAPGALEPFVRAVGAARAASLPVIYVRVGFRDGFPEVSPRNRSFAAIASGSARLGDVHPAVAPAPGEVVVTKRRVSAFSGSDLDVVLRARDIDSLVLTGIATSGVVLSTLREAADRDFRLTVLADACLDADPEVHRMLIEKVFPRQAEVTTVADWVRQLEVRP